MDEREQKQLLAERNRTSRNALIISLAAMLLIGGIVAALAFLLPGKTDTPSESNLSALAPDNSVQSPADESGTSTAPDVSTESTESLSDDESKNETSDVSQTESSAESTQPNVSQDTSSEVSTEPVESDFETGWIINNMGWTFVYNKNGYQQFNGTSAQALKYGETLNLLAVSSNTNTKFYSMLVPTKTAIDYDSIPSKIIQVKNFYCSSQSKFISNVDSALNGITPVGIYDSIVSHKDEYLYFKTDINWTSLAAYYAYKEFSAVTGADAVALESCATGKYENYLGRFYTAVNSGSDADSQKAASLLRENKDYIDYYKIPGYESIVVTMHRDNKTFKNLTLVGNSVASTATAYYTFLGNDGEFFEIQTGNENGKTLVVVGDSSVPPMLQFLAANYTTVYYVNPEIYSGKFSTFLTSHPADDVLFMNYCSNGAYPTYMESFASLG